MIETIKNMQDTLKDFLHDSGLAKALNCREIEKQAGMTKNSFAPWLNGNRSNLSEPNRNKLMEYLYQLADRITGSI